MTEQEFLDTLLQDRISMLLDNRDRDSRKSEFKKPSETFDNMLKSEYAAEQLINSLPEQEHDLIQGYIDALINMFNTDEPFLYQQGIFDGIRLMKLIAKF